MALFVDLVALSNGLHGSVQMDSVALFSWIGWLRHHGIFSEYSEYMEIEQEKYDKMMEKAGIKALKRAVELGAFTQEKLELWLK